MGPTRAKTFARAAHRRLGPWIAAFLLLQAVTGAMIVFRDDIAAVGHNHDMAQNIGVDAVVERARTLGAGNLMRLDLPAEDGGIYVATFRVENGGTAVAEIATDGAVLSHGPRWHYPLRLLAAFHHDWFLGNAGARLQTVLGLVATLTMIAGWLVWWPGIGRVAPFFARRPTSRGAAKFYWRHVLLAVLSLPLTATMLASGMLVADRGDLQPLISAPAAIPPPMPPIRADISASIDEMIARAEAAAPSMRAHDLRFSPGRLLVVLRAEDSMITGRVWLRTDTGEVLSTQHRTNADRGTYVYDVLLRLHDGEWLGNIGKIFVFAAGLSLAAVALLGLVRRAKRSRPK